MQSWWTGIKSLFSGAGRSVDSEVTQPFQNATDIIKKYNLAIQHGTLTQSGWQRLLGKCDEGLKSYLISIKGASASQKGYEISLQGNIRGFGKVSSAIKQYNLISGQGEKEQQAFSAAVSTTNTRLGDYLSKLGSAKGSMLGYIGSLIGATARTIALKAVTIALNTAISMGVSLIISGIVSAISNWINKTENMIRASEEALDTIKSLNDELKENQKTLNDTAQRFAELSQGVDQLSGKNISLGKEDYDEFLDLSNQLADTFPTLSRIYDENGNAIVQLSGNVDTIVESLQGVLDVERELTHQKIAEELPTAFDGVSEKAKEYEEELNDLKEQRDLLTESLNTFDSKNVKNFFRITSTDAEKYSQMIADYTYALERAGVSYERYDDGKVWYGEYDKNGNQVLAQSSTFSIPEKEFENAKDAISSRFKSLSETYADEAEKFSQKISDINEDIDSVNAKNKSNWNSLISSIFAWLSTDDSFKIMDDSMQATMQNIINNFDWGSLDFSSWDEAKNFIQDNLLSLLDTEDGENVLVNVSPMLDVQTQFNEGDITVSEYKDKLKEFLSLTNSLPDEVRKSILLMFDIQTSDDGSTSSNTDNLIENIKKELFDNFDNNFIEDTFNADGIKGLLNIPKNIDDFVGELTLDELKIAQQIAVSDDVFSSWDELKEKIQEVQTTLLPNESSAVSTLSDSVKQIATQLEPQFTQLGEAYKKIFTADGFKLDDVDNSMLEGIRKSFAEIEKEVGVSFDATELDSFFATLSDGESTSEQVQQAFNELATSYLHSTDTLKNLNDETANAITKQLEELGVENASELVTSTLAAKKEFLAQTGRDLASATDEEVNAFIHEQIAAGNASQALMILQLRKSLVTDTKIDLSSDINQIIALAKAAAIGVKGLSKLEGARRVFALKDSGANVPETAIKAAEKNVEDEVNDIFKIDVNFDASTLTSPSGGGGNGGGGGGDKNAEKSKETFDLIEILISRIERKITSLDLTASSVFKKWSDRNKSLVDEIKEVTKEIDIQEKGYKRYLKEANSVGLSKEWRKKIKNGEVDIQEIDTSSDSGKKLAEKIKNYQTWYEKAIACKDAVEQLHEKESTLYKTKFENVVSKFDGYLSLIEHKKNMTEESISRSEEKGYVTSIKYYRSLMDSEGKNIEQLKKEQTELTNAMNDAVKNGNIKKKSEAWYEMKKQINAVTESIEEANTAMIKYSNSIRDIQWQVFDMIQEKISQITSESDFLINLMENEKLYKDNGQLTETGMSTMGLHGLNYNVNMAQADKYRKEIEDIDSKLKSGEYDQYDQNVIERRQELLELQRESILAAEDEKQSIRDMVQEGINVELNALKELIDAYNEALDSQKDLYDYQKKVNEQSKELASLQKQMSALQGDTSEENKARLQRLKVSIEEAKDNLQETEYDKYISDQKKLLDDMYSDYEEVLNKRLDNLDILISDMIAEINANAVQINKTISDESKNVGYSLTNSMKNVWNSTGNILSVYGDDFSKNATAVNNTLLSIDTGVQDMIKILDGTGSGSTSSSSGNTISSSGSNTSSSGISMSGIAANAIKNLTKGLIDSGSGSGAGGSGYGVSSTGGFGNTNGLVASNLKTSDTTIALPNAAILLRASNFISTLTKKKLTDKNLKSHSSLFQYIYKKSKGRAITDEEILKLGDILGVKNLPKKASKLESKHLESVLKSLKSVGYKNGARNIQRSGLAWTNEGWKDEVMVDPSSGQIVRTSDGATLTHVKSGNAILNSDATDNLYDFMNNPKNYILDHLVPSKLSPVYQNQTGSKSVDVHLDNMNFNLPNVKNYEEFVYAMQHDKRIGDTIKAMTTDEMFGKSSLRKSN